MSSPNSYSSTPSAKSHHYNPNCPKFNPRWRFNPHHARNQLPQRRDEEFEAKKREAEKEHNNRSQMPQRRESSVFNSSVYIQPEWNMLDQIPFFTFSKLSFSVPEPEDMLLSDGLEYYVV